MISDAAEREVRFDPEFAQHLERNMAVVSRFQDPFALYWIKSGDADPAFHQMLAGACRQEDILCHNHGGEFVVILTSADEQGVKGFEQRLERQAGQRLQGAKRGYRLYAPALAE